MTQRYDTYKDSGVQWLGEIPGHWGCVRLKNVCTGFSNGTTADQVDFLDGTVSVTRIETISKGIINYEKVGHVQYSNNLLNYRLQVGDILFSHINSYERVGNCALYEGEHPLYHGMNLMRITPISKFAHYKFIHYYLISPLFLKQVQLKCKPAINQVSIPGKYVKDLRLNLPPLSEQRSIVSYLDDKCGMIDEWVTKKQKEVEHLKELKQRVIADAVTRGLNPHVKMKETGVFWWKETPEHWQKIRLGFVLQKMNRQRLPNSELLVCTNKGKVIKRGDTKIGLIADSEDIYQGVAKGDLLIHGMDTWHGAIAVSNFNGMCTPVVHVCTSNENLYFVAYYMQVMAYSKIFKIISNGVRQNTSDFRSWSKVDKIPIMLPSKHEQKQIVSYLDAKTSKIDKLIANITKEIECIKEYKQRLISDVVIGQIKVC